MEQVQNLEFKTPEERISDLKLLIPVMASPAAAYVPYSVVDDILYISGQLPIENGEVKYKGIVGKQIDVNEAQEAAKLCALNIISVITDACMELSNVERIINLQVLVASDDGFIKQHIVANGASDLIYNIFGNEVGSHTRAAYGVSSLPLGACVEITAMAKLKSEK